MHGGLAVAGEMEAHRVCSPNATSSGLRSSWLSSSPGSLRAPLKDAATVFEPTVRKCTVMQAASSGVQREGLGMSQVEGNGTVKVKVKEAKLWGGRFEKGVTPAVERFGQSVSYDWKLYKHDLMGSRAHASMLAKQVCSNSSILRRTSSFSHGAEAGGVYGFELSKALGKAILASSPRSRCV